jgi:hypothetical protein
MTSLPDYSTGALEVVIIVWAVETHADQRDQQIPPLEKAVCYSREGMRGSWLNDNQIIVPRKTKAPTANDGFLHREGLVI